ncbi:MAG: branched-chain amino acid ABC transporter, partial [Campylobacteraceae bacterium]|nr:branched-chain amino acid ABC transporter [Campylobacteraceae bacterium]
MSSYYIISAIIVAAIATYATRILPFLFFAKKKPGPLLRHIEFFMPMMIMVILVFYAIKDVSFGDYPYGVPEILGIITAVLMHLWRKNALLSIIVATAFYMT